MSDTQPDDTKADKLSVWRKIRDLRNSNKIG
jgi:hypothetical protein